MKCEVCGASPVTSGIALFRQNPKEEIGIWRCGAHNRKPVDDEVAEIVAIVQGASPEEPKNG